MSNITSIILTKNEDKHLQRCIDSIKPFSNNIVIIDSFSTDKTINIAKNNNCIILERAWSNHADQFNWALENINFEMDWVLRIDADEVILGDFKNIFNKANHNSMFKGFALKRSIKFCGKLMKHGGIASKPITRIFKIGYGYYENRLMDEHLNIKGEIGLLDLELVDENLNSIGWWINKHNKYASLEAFEKIKQEKKHEKLKPSNSFNKNTKLIKYLKDNIYYRMPVFIRSFLYFNFRYFFKFGFLDGYRGFIFHFLQGFWYRFLVDIKLNEYNRIKSLNYEMKDEDLISSILDLDINLIRQNLNE